MSQYPSFYYTFSFLFVTYLSFSWFSWKMPFTTSPEEFFPWILRSNSRFSCWKKVQKLAITICCCLITDPVPSYIFVNVLFTWKFGITVFGFPKGIVLSSLILFIRNSDLANEKIRQNHNIYKIYCYSFIISLLLHVFMVISH